MPQDPFAQYAVSDDDPFAQYAEGPRGADGFDYGVLYDPNRKAASAEDFAAAPPQPKGSAAGRFFSGLGEALNPVALAKGLYGAVTHPIDAAKAAIGAQVAQGQKAVDLAKKGEYNEAAGRGLAAILPLLGPAAAGAGEAIASGDVAGGLGKGAGLLAPMAVGPLMTKVLPKGVKVPGLAETDPAAADALALAEREGVPLDAATASGNRFVKAAQHVADRSLGGSIIAGKATQAQAEGLATLGEQLASKGFSVPISAEEAGAGVSDMIRGKMRGHAAEADEAYTQLRTLAADPKHLTTIEPTAAAIDETAPTMFPGVGHNANTQDIFLSALKEARKQGYTGSAADLKGIFDDRVASARNLRAASAEGNEYSPQALLASVRELGGIRPFDKHFQPGTALVTKLSGEYENLKQLYANNRGASAVFRNDGLAIDDMVDQLRQDPRWKTVVSEDPEAFKEMLTDVAGAHPSPADLQHYLRGVGVQPGAKWWESAGETKQIPMAVDLRRIKEAVRPTYDQLKRESELVPLMGDKARALTTLDRLVNGRRDMHGNVTPSPDWASLPDADEALGELKSFTRTKEPALRTIGQGKVAFAVDRLHAAVGQRAAEAGPGVVRALENGRKATIAKYDAAEVLDSLHAEPVRTIRALTAPGDTAIEKLRAVAEQAPDALPAVGRAKLEDLLAQSPQKRFAEWQKLGTATKQMLYKDPAYVKDLDSFMRLAKMTADTPNPSGTAHTLLVAGQGEMLLHNPITGAVTQVAASAVSSLLHSQTGVRLLTRGLRIPVANKAAAAAWMTDLAAATSPSGSRSPVAVPAR